MLGLTIFLILICIVGILILPYWIIPANPFPKPSGQWQVGTSELIWNSPSHGFIVISINHPGSSVGTMLTDGSQIGVDLDGLDRIELLVSKIAVDRANDLSMALDKVISLNYNHDSFLHQKINTSKIFAVGHSIGGSASFAACGKDLRISKSVNLDGFFYMDEIDLSCMEKEFMLIQPNRHKSVAKGGKSQSEFDLLMAKDKARIEQLSGNVNFSNILLQSATHVSFMDLPLIINPALSKPIGLFGKADGLDLLLKTSAVTIDFFNK